MGLISKLTQTGNVIKRLHNIGSIDGDAYNQLMQNNEETLAMLHEKACAKATPKPRAKKKALRLFGVVCSALYVALCTGIMILLDNYTDLQNYVSWVLGWCMSMIYVAHVFIRR